MSQKNQTPVLVLLASVVLLVLGTGVAGYTIGKSTSQESISSFASSSQYSIVSSSSMSSSSSQSSSEISSSISSVASSSEQSSISSVSSSSATILKNIKIYYGYSDPNRFFDLYQSSRSTDRVDIATFGLEQMALISDSDTASGLHKFLNYEKDRPNTCASGRDFELGIKDTNAKLKFCWAIELQDGSYTNKFENAINTYFAQFATVKKVYTPYGDMCRVIGDTYYTKVACPF
jgi:hypothetical protein